MKVYDGKLVFYILMPLSFSSLFQYLQFCDEIVVIENGKITERGHHEELNQIGDGYYKSMIEKYHRLEQNGM